MRWVLPTGNAAQTWLEERTQMAGHGIGDGSFTLGAALFGAVLVVFAVICFRRRQSPASDPSGWQAWWTTRQIALVGAVGLALVVAGLALVA